ncbi:MAG: TIGR03619 family F420-dependent LLM class oxidoreductase [Microthrixaceae bacterium]|nr:TIGR03619 family F420-dependent LLM class oxidoreductase [Microthrixaceae bacterium]
MAIDPNHDDKSAVQALGAGAVGAVTGGPGLLVALHGYGDQPLTALSWGRRIAPPDWDVIAPCAQPDRSGQNSWFSTGPRGVDPHEIGDSMDRIESLLVEASARGSRVALAGFSQGAALALAMAWRGTVAERVVAICGFFPEADGQPHLPNGTKPSPLLIIGTDGDTEVPAFLGQDAAAMFEHAGHVVTNMTVQGRHHIDASVAGIAADYVYGLTPKRPWISVGIPVERVEYAGEFLSGDAISEIAQRYEQLGFHAGYVTDHPAPDDRWLTGGGHQALEPVTALSAVAVATKKLKVHTNVYVLPYRNPFLAAKGLASVDAISGGRLIAGVAAGYVRPEFSALGVDFERRGQLLEEALTVLPRIWSGESFHGEGQGWETRSATSLPATYGGPPLWIGGNSKAAMRRAVTLAQGWSPMPTPAGSGRGLKTAEIVDHSALKERLAEATELCESVKRPTPLTICFVPFGMGAYMSDPRGRLGMLADEINELFEIGVDWFPLMVPGNSRSELLDNAAALAESLGLVSST